HLLRALCPSFLLTTRRHPSSPLFPYTTLFRSSEHGIEVELRDPDASLIDYLVDSKPDVVWPALHGASGEDGSLRGLLEFLNLPRSEEHTSELQSRENLVCRLLLEKKKNNLHAE